MLLLNGQTSSSLTGRTRGLPQGQLLDPVAELLQSFGANIVRLVDYSPGSDITPLTDAGVPSFAPIQDGRNYFDYHHSAADTLDKVIPQQLRENAAVVAVLTYFLAEMPEPFSRLQ